MAHLDLLSRRGVRVHRLISIVLSLSLSLEPTTPRPSTRFRPSLPIAGSRSLRESAGSGVGGTALELVSWKLLGGAPREGDRWTIVWRRRNEIPRPLSPYRLEKDVEETFAYIDRQFSARTNPRAAFRLRLYRGRQVLVPPSPPTGVPLFQRVPPSFYDPYTTYRGGFFSP